MNRFPKEEVNRIFQELNYLVFKDAGSMVIYQDDSPHLYNPRFAMVVFEDGHVGWADLQRILDYEGITQALFIAYHES